MPLSTKVGTILSEVKKVDPNEPNAHRPTCILVNLDTADLRKNDRKDTATARRLNGSVDTNHPREILLSVERTRLPP